MASNDEEIRVAITAQADEYNAAMEQAAADTEDMAAKVAKGAEDAASATQAKLDAMQRLNAAFSKEIDTTERLVEAQEALKQARDAGLISVAEYDAQLTALPEIQTAVAETTAAATVATEANTAALKINGQTAREIGVLIGELARGNYHRLEGSTITLANRTGFLSKAIGFLISPAGIAAAAVAGLGFAAVKGSEDFDKFENVIELTNGAVGLSAGELQTMADNIGHVTKDSGDATTAVQKLAASGRFAGDELDQAATAAVQFALATGMKVEQVTSLLVKMATNPKAPLDELTNSLHVLSDAQAQEVEDLLRTGDKAGAAGIEIQAFAARAKEAETQVASQTNGLVGYFSGLGHRIAEATHDLVEFMNVSTGGGDAAAKLEVINRQIDTIRHSVLLLNPGMAMQLPILEHQRDELQQQLNIQKEQEQQVRRNAAALREMVPQKGTFDALKKEGLSGLNLAGNLRQQLAAMEDAENVSYQNREAFNREYWGYVLRNTKDGTQAHIEALQEVDQIQQRADQEQARDLEEKVRAAKEVSRKREEDAKKASQAIIQGFENERQAASVESGARIAIDQRMMDRVTQMYGQQSAQFKRALSERLADTRAFVAASNAAEKQRADDAIKQMNEVIRFDAEAFQHAIAIDQQKVTEGRETADQLIAFERDMADREAAIDKSVLESYLQTYSQFPSIRDAINKQIEAIEAKHQQRMDALQKKAEQQRGADAKKAMQPIMQAFDQSITGMIQGSQTLSQAWDHLLQSLLVSEARGGLQRVETWGEQEAAKSAATAAGNETRAASDDAARATGMSESAAMDEKQIFNSAKTAAANAYASLAAIPVVGPVLAPVGAAAAFAGVMTFDNLASAAGGWERVPADDAPTLLHRNEMVLPATLADRVRDMTAPAAKQAASSGGGGTVHIHAMDSRSFREFLNRNPRAISSAMNRAGRNGWRW